MILFFFSPDISQEKWEQILAANNLNIVELRDARYNQIVHMVSAANGAEEFYTIEVNTSLYSNIWKPLVLNFFAENNIMYFLLHFK